MELRFSGDQESAEKRFQADVLKLEQNYQSELKALSESQAEQKLRLEVQVQEALENAEVQKRMMQEYMEQEREQLDQQWKKEWHELERLHVEKMEELLMKNQQLQHELDDLTSIAQTREVELSRQLNDLHNQLEAKNSEMFSIAETQIKERTELLTEQNDLKMKMEELEMLLQQVAMDFELERKELKEHESILEKKLKDLVNDTEVLIAEREMLKNRVEELELESSHGLSSADNAKEIEESKEMRTFMEEVTIEKSFMPSENACQIDSSNLDCLLSPIDEPNNKQTIMEAPSALEVVPEISKDFDDSYKESMCMLHVKTDPTESEEHNQIIETEHDNTWIQSPWEIQRNPEVVSCSIASTCCGTHNPASPVPYKTVESENKPVFPQRPSEEVSSREAIVGEYAKEGGKNDGVFQCKEENKSQDLVNESPFPEDELYHEIATDPSVLEEVDDPDELSLLDVEVNCLPECSHRQEVVSHTDYEPVTTKTKDECTHNYVETLNEDTDCSLLKLQVLCNTTTEENILLHEQISLLQQKTEILENLLAHNGEKIKTGNQILEENYTLKIKILLLIQHVKVLEIKVLKMTDLQISYEDCLCENAKLKKQNCELEKRVWRLKSRNFYGFQNHSNVSLAEENSRLRKENRKLSELLGEVKRQREISAVRPWVSPAVESLLGLTDQPEVEVQATTELHDCCEKLERENSNLRRAILELQDESQEICDTTRAHR